MAARKEKKTARKGNRTAGGRDENRRKEYAGRRPDIPHLGEEPSDRKEVCRKRIFEIIQIGQTEDLPSRLFDLFLVLAIVLNISALILETFSELDRYMPVFKGIEVVTVVIFTIEYAARIWTADYLYPDCSHVRAVLKFLLSFDGIVDLLTILPFFFLSGFAAFRILRVVRIFHLFRINAYYDSFNVITTVLAEKKNQIISSILIILILMVASSLSMYSVEHDAQPDVFKNAFSGIWWSLATVFTVGYGDIYPITILGRTLAVLTTFLGVGAVAIPTGIISAGFVEQYTRLQRDITASQYKNTTEVIYVDSDSPFCQITIGEAEDSFGICISAVIRHGNVLVGADDILLEARDTIVCIKL